VITVHLGRNDMLAALKLAKERMARPHLYENYRNSTEGHFVGALGEFATLRWAEICQYRPKAHFQYNDSLCDIYLNRGRHYCEVKTWRFHQWLGLGRAINEKQYPRVCEKADTVIWCTAPIPTSIDLSKLLQLYPTGIDVCLCGWNWVVDFELVAPAKRAV